MVDFRKLTEKARDVVEQRGGTDSVKQDLQELKDIARGDASAKDKLRDAAQALREPGAGERPGEAPRPGEATTEPARPAASEPGVTPNPAERPGPGAAA